MGIMKELNNDRQDILKIVQQYINDGYIAFNQTLSKLEQSPTTDKKTSFMLNACINDIEKIRKETHKIFNDTIESYNFYKE